MKKFLMIAAAAGIMAISASANAGEFKTGACAACHKIDGVIMGPAWKDVAAKYGSAEALAKVFKDGFKPEERKFATEPKFKSGVSTMTAQFNSLIKGHEDDAAAALFAAVKAGKM